MKKDYASPLRHWALTGHGPLTISRASTDVLCLIRHGVDLAPVHNRESFGHCRLTDSSARTNEDTGRSPARSPRGEAEGARAQT